MTRRLRSRLPHIAGIFLGTMAALVSACSGVEQDTHLIEVSADVAPHTVELWYETFDPYEWKRAYAVRFPRYYYAYDHNHRSRRQSAIGLLFDRSSLDPLAVSIAREKGIALSDASSSALDTVKAGMEAALDPPRPRAMLVRVSNVYPAKRPLPDSTYHELFKPIGERAGFRLYVPWNSSRRPESPRELDGYSFSDPLVWMRCSGGNENCSFSVGYRTSTVNFVLHRSEFKRAMPVAKKLLELLKSHDLTPERQIREFDRAGWAKGAGNSAGVNPRARLVSAAREAGVTVGATRSDVRALLGTPDSSGPEADIWYLGRDDLSPDFRTLRVDYDAAGRVTAVTERAL